jgi:glycosyltransferase involved in cell wall biosynthesis
MRSWRRLWSDEKLILRDTLKGTGEQGSVGTDNRVGKRQSIRVAYLGPTPLKGAGGPVGCAWLVLEELARSGVRLDLYLTFTEDQKEIAALGLLPGAKVIPVGSMWRWNRWYSKNRLMAVVTGLGTIALGRRRLVKLLVEQHKLAPYDAMYQFSTIEVFGRRRDRQKLPTMVLHPSVHAAGELQWMRNERELSRRCEGWLRPRLVIGWLLFRSRRQRRDLGRAAVVLALSDAFGRHLAEDYGIDPTRIRIAPNPIDLESFRPRLQVPSTEGALRVAVVGRISVRKGLELVVELSHRMRDLAGLVHFEIVGDPSPWSDYSRLLDDLDPTMASIHGHLPYDELKEWIPTCDLLLQPAKYEPFGLTVGEALACGVPVVVTSEVGAGEQLSEACSIRIPPCDVEALEKAVREMVARLTSPARGPMRAAARSEAERLWSAASTTLPVTEALLGVAGLRTEARAGSPSG